MYYVILSLGSNKSYVYKDVTLTPIELLYKAYERLHNVLRDVVVSNVYKTKAMYVTDQEDFYNIALSGYYSESPESLLKATQDIELTLGRNRTHEIKNGPRSLDIDILLFSDFKISTEKLDIPHAKMHERPFVLVPMLEILPLDADSTIREYYTKCLLCLDSSGVVKIKPLLSEEDIESRP